MNHLGFSKDKLSTETITNLVSSEKCGAVSLFVGTTRDNFEEKEVLSLEYEAYESMALKAMKKICDDIREQWKDIENIAIYHRLGLVPVKEASIVIAISSPHRKEAIQAVEFCIDNVKKSVPIWKKEIYKDSEPKWKENKELPKLKRRKLDLEPDLNDSFVPPHLIQIKASKAEIDKRIENFMIRKREEINAHNIRDFCSGDRSSENICARIDSVFMKRKDSKSHLVVDKVLNNYYHRDQSDSEYLMKFIPVSGVEERVQNLEVQLSLYTPTPRNIYKRLKLLEERLLYLESLSPEYVQFWDKTGLGQKSAKKKVFTIDEIDCLIQNIEQNKS